MGYIKILKTSAYHKRFQVGACRVGEEQHRRRHVKRAMYTMSPPPIPLAHVYHRARISSTGQVPPPPDR